MTLFDLPEALRPAYGRLRALETLLCLHRLLQDGAQQAAQRPAAMEAVHAYLMEHLDQRIPIDALARRFLMNPTTLKAAFKAAYGASLAAHIRAHRMERAAALLRGTDQSVAAIASAVGYESQSKLTAAFRDAFGMPPTEYRRRHAPAAPAPGRLLRTGGGRAGVKQGRAAPQGPPAVRPGMRAGRFVLRRVSAA